MAETTTIKKKTPLDDVPGPEQVREFTEQAREYTDQLMASAKTFGIHAVDAYEQAAKTALQLQHQAAESVKVDWLPSIMPAAIDANLTFAEEVNAAYVKAVRAILA